MTANRIQWYRAAKGAAPPVDLSSFCVPSLLSRMPMLGGGYLPI